MATSAYTTTPHQASLRISTTSEDANWPSSTSSAKTVTGVTPVRSPQTAMMPIPRAIRTELGRLVRRREPILHSLTASCLWTLRLSLTYLGVIGTTTAEWSHSQKSPDFLGQIESYAAGADSAGLGDLLVIRCVGDDTLELALLEPSTASQIDTTAKLAGVTGQMFVKIDNGPVQRFDKATVEVWNRNAIGIVIKGRNPELLQLVRSIGAAKSKIAVGVDLGSGFVVTKAFGAEGSTAAVNAVSKACQLDH
jgi:hypothetical protein